MRDHARVEELESEVNDLRKKLERAESRLVSIETATGASLRLCHVVASLLTLLLSDSLAM